jgi:hypothetical protein
MEGIYMATKRKKATKGQLEALAKARKALKQKRDKEKKSTKK